MTDLEFDLTQASPAERYAMLTSVIVPRPIAWVSTVSDDGVRNLAPHSWFTQASIDPPCIVFSSIGQKDTLANIRATGSFVVNLVDAPVLEAMNLTAADAPSRVDEFTLAELDAAPAAVVDAPRVAAAPGHLECRLEAEFVVGDGVLVVGRVVHVHLDGAVRATDGSPRAEVAALAPMSRLGGGDYGHLGEIVTLHRPSWDELQSSSAP